jgi:hypothetical protein
MFFSGQVVGFVFCMLHDIQKKTFTLSIKTVRINLRIAELSMVKQVLTFFLATVYIPHLTKCLRLFAIASKKGIFVLTHKIKSHFTFHCGI